MISTSEQWRRELLDFEPMAQRALADDSGSFIRFRVEATMVAGFVSLPYDVIAGRSILLAGEDSDPGGAYDLGDDSAGGAFGTADDSAGEDAATAGDHVQARQPGTPAVTRPTDVTYAVGDFLDWIAGTGSEPSRRDAHWLSALPSRAGWRRVDQVPDSVIRDRVRAGALLAKDLAADGRSTLGAGRTAQQSLLSSTVLRMSGESEVEVPLRALTALTRMGFLPRASMAAVDLAPGWIRVAAPYGSTFVSSGAGLLHLGTL